jgi:hypothetical protein
MAQEIAITTASSSETSDPATGQARQSIFR